MKSPSICTYLFSFTTALLITSSSILGGDFDNLSRHSIYQRLKDVDDNGLTVGRVSPNGTPNTDIVLDEQSVASQGRTDLSPNRLFKSINSNRLTTGTYPLFTELLNNYTVRSGDNETVTSEEQQEIDAFVDAIVNTRPMKVAHFYINNNLSESLSAQQFRDSVKKIWFEIYTNNFNGNPTPNCSGFEHVFVGEGKFSNSNRGEITGYHGWVQFYKQEEAGDVNYLGTFYGLPSNRMPLNPCVITLRMIWDHDRGNGNNVELFKEKGGFFVGLSPECEIAMGTVAYFELLKGMMPNDKRRVTIDQEEYDLVLHPEKTASQSTGEHIRSFFPILIGTTTSNPTNPATNNQPPTPPAIRNSLVLIIRAMPNPEGNDQTGEWIELKNTSTQNISLNGWELRDKQAGRRPVAGDLGPQETRRFDVPRNQFSLILGNNSGKILLLDDQSDVIDEVSYSNPQSDEPIDFTP